MSEINAPHWGSVTKVEALNGLRNRIPSFDECWAKTVAEHGEDLGSRIVYMSLAQSLLRLPQCYPHYDRRLILEYLEFLCVEGDELVQTLACTYFIDTMLHVADEEPEQMAAWFEGFGPESRAYALRYNRMMGCKTKGLEY